MAFLFSATLAIALETAGMLAAIVAVAWRLKPRAATGTWAAGLGAVPIGALLFLCVLVLKGIVAWLLPFVARPADPGWGPLLVHGLVAGTFASVSEEVVRFGAGALLFRRAHGKPIVAGALFGLGWAGMEVLLVIVQQIKSYVFLAKLFGGPSTVRMPFVPLLVPVERFGAVTLHVALAGLAAAAAMALARKRPGFAAGLFAAALAAHALLDAWVRVMYVRYASLVDAGDMRGVPGTLLLEAGFVTGGVLALVIASRLPAVSATEAAATPAP